MKLLYCIPALYNAGGMERVITEKVNYLINLPNYEIIIVTTDQAGLPIRFQLDSRIQILHLNIDFNGHFAANLIIKYMLHKRKLKIYKTRLLALLEEYKVDICISLCGKEIEFLDKLPVNCKKIAEIHFALNYRKHFLTSRKSGIIWEWLGDVRTYQLKKSIEKLDKLVVLTKEDRLKWGKTDSNIIDIPNPNPLQNGKRALLNAKRVISIGKLDAQKGYDMLIDTWALVTKINSDWTLDIFGVGEWKVMLKQRIKELNLQGKINLRGSTTNVLNNYLESSIYVMSSRYEGLPMVLIEAMSCGLPIISFDCECGPREVINDGVDGFLVEQGSIDKLAEKICLLIQDNELRKKMGRQAFKASKRFSKDPIMQQWVELFDNIIE